MQVSALDSGTPGQCDLLLCVLHHLTDAGLCLRWVSVHSDSGGHLLSVRNRQQGAEGRDKDLAGDVPSHSTSLSLPGQTRTWQEDTSVPSVSALFSFVCQRGKEKGRLWSPPRLQDEEQLSRRASRQCRSERIPWQVHLETKVTILQRCE